MQADLFDCLHIKSPGLYSLSSTNSNASSLKLDSHRLLKMGWIFSILYVTILSSVFCCFQSSWNVCLDMMTTSTSYIQTCQHSTFVERPLSSLNAPIMSPGLFFYWTLYSLLLPSCSLLSIAPEITIAISSSSTQNKELSENKRIFMWFINCLI